MKILIAGSVVSDYGKEEVDLVKSVASEFKKQGHTVDYFFLPLERDVLAFGEQSIAYSMIDTSGADLLVTIGYAASLIPHKNKYTYLLDSFPEVNEYWNTQYGVLASPQYENIKEAVYKSEKFILKSSKAVIMSSKTLRDDFVKRHEFTCDYHYQPYAPFISENQSITNTAESYIITETSLLPHQRFELALDALVLSNDLHLKVIVPRTRETYFKAAQHQIDSRNLRERVTLIRADVSNTLLTSAKAYLVTDYESRRVSGTINSVCSIGCPIVAPSDCGAIKEYASDEVNMIETGTTASDIAEGIRRALEMDKVEKNVVTELSQWTLKSLTERLMGI